MSFKDCVFEKVIVNETIGLFSKLKIECGELPSNYEKFEISFAKDKEDDPELISRSANNNFYGTLIVKKGKIKLDKEGNIKIINFDDFPKIDYSGLYYKFLKTKFVWLK